jgi:hypothetical protein
MMEIRKTVEIRIQLLRFNALSFMITIPEERNILELDPVYILRRRNILTPAKSALLEIGSANSNACCRRVSEGVNPP